jgi:hypothetical protein
MCFRVEVGEAKRSQTDARQVEKATKTKTQTALPLSSLPLPNSTVYLRDDKTVEASLQF